MAYTSQVTWEALKTLDSATLAGAYKAIGGPLLNPSFMLKIYNNSTNDILISIDGVNDYDVVPHGTYVVYKIDNERGLNSISQGTQFYAKSAAGVGNIYVASLYAVHN